jgi:predicted amidohydrolase
MIVYPWGTILAEFQDDTGEGIQTADLDMDMLQILRQDMPIFQHKRYDLY